MTANADPTWPLPDNPDPPSTVCYQIDIPNDQKHLDAFMGAVALLSNWYMWDRDELKQGKDAARAWWKALHSIRPCQSSTPTGGGGGGENDFMIRQNPTNPCILESSLDGVNWCEWADISKCIPGATQPGAGTGVPAPNGGTKTYCYGVNSGGVLLIPAYVNSGDVLTLTDVSGAGTDGVTLAWYCPNGQSFAADTCSGLGHLDGGDPLPTAKHMALIYNVDGTYYDAMSGPVTVPGGVTNAQVTVQVNAPFSSSQQGSYSLCVQVTNNQAGTWSHTFDFTAGTFDWNPGAFLGVALGTWVAGLGWQSNSYASPQDCIVQISHVLPSPRPVIKCEAVYSRTNAGVGTGSMFHDMNGSLASVVQWTQQFDTAIGDHDQLVTQTGNIDTLGLDFRIDPAACTGIVVSKIIITGTGTDPYLM